MKNPNAYDVWFDPEDAVGKTILRIELEAKTSDGRNFDALILMTDGSCLAVSSCGCCGGACLGYRDHP